MEKEKGNGEEEGEEEEQEQERDIIRPLLYLECAALYMGGGDTKKTTPLDSKKVLTNVNTLPFLNFLGFRL